MFLTDSEITQLTGLKRGKEQCDWLNRRGWVFETTNHGKPRVAVEYARQKMGIQSEKPTRWQLNFA